MNNKESEVVKVVEDYYKVKYKDMRCKNARTYPTCIAKKMAIQLLRENVNMPWNDIAERFNTTPRAVLYQCTNLRYMIDHEPKIAQEYNEILTILKQRSQC